MAPRILSRETFIGSFKLEKLDEHLVPLAYEFVGQRRRSGPA
jgi:hypothetical protein